MGSGIQTYVLDVLPRRHARRGLLPNQPLNTLQRLLQVLDPLNHRLDILLVLEVRHIRHNSVQTPANRHAAPRNGATAEVLAHSDRLGAVDVERGLDTSSPLQLAHNPVGARDLLEEDGADVGGRLREDAGAGVDVGVAVGGDGVVVGLVEVVELDRGVGDDGVGLRR